MTLIYHTISNPVQETMHESGHAVNAEPTGQNWASLWSAAWQEQLCRQYPVIHCHCHLGMEAQQDQCDYIRCTCMEWHSKPCERLSDNLLISEQYTKVVKQFEVHKRALFYFIAKNNFNWSTFSHKCYIITLQTETWQMKWQYLNLNRGYTKQWSHCESTHSTKHRTIYWKY